MRLRQELARSKSQLPRHIAVLCDGNRRWARDEGHDDVSYGYRVGRRQDRRDAALVPGDRRRDGDRVPALDREPATRRRTNWPSLIEIITDVVEEICAPVNRWSVRTVGDLELLGEEPARRLRDAVDSTHGSGRGAFHVNVAVGYGGRQEIADAVRALLEQGTRQRRDGRAARRVRHRRRHLGEPVHLRPARSRSRHQDVGGAAALRIPAVAERLFGDVVHRGALAGVPSGRLPARAARLHAAAPALRRVAPAPERHVRLGTWLRCPQWSSA